MAKKQFRVEQVSGGSHSLRDPDVRKAKSASAGQVSKLRQQMQQDARRNPKHGSDWVRVTNR